jgi:hypothetical protein
LRNLWYASLIWIASSPLTGSGEKLWKVAAARVIAPDIP